MGPSSQLRIGTMLVCLALFTFGCAPASSEGSAVATAVELPSAVPTVVVTDWQMDLDVLEEVLEREHADLFHTIDETAWRADVADARRRAVDWSPVEGYFEVARLLASIGDGHTTTADPTLSYYPFALASFADGVWVVASDTVNQEIVGSRVIAIDGIAVEDLVEAGSALVSGDTPEARRANVPGWLSSPDFVVATGLDRPTPGIVTVDNAGTITETAVEPIVGHVDAVISFRGDRPPVLAEGRPDAFYWTTTIDEHNTIYMNFRLAAEAQDLAMTEVAGVVLGAADTHGFDRFIIDLRQNPGGNSLVLRPLIDALAGHPLGDNVVVLIGPRTYSSAVLNAVELRDRLGATLVGSPSTQAVSHYGEVNYLTLPRTGTFLAYATKFFDRGEIGLLTPDIDVPLTAADYFEGVDPVLEAALALGG